MAKGMSIHIGLNRVDPQHYTDQYGRPWEGKLVACESDAHCMEAIARQQGFTPTVLLSDAATSAAVIAAIKDAARQLQTGDALFLSYSGHGGQVPDRNGATDDEPDRMDETWCLFDRQLVDDELFALWGEFQPGVHILMLSDSCHSGTVSRDAAEEAAKTGPAVRELPAEVQVGTYQAHRDTYDRIQAETPDAGASEPKASVVLISGCQDNQVSMDGRVNGLFTEKLLLTWNDGRYRGGIPRFHQQIIARMPRTQQPNLYRVGPTDAVYEQRRPFSI